jgi:hypothetical protein
MASIFAAQSIDRRVLKRNVVGLAKAAKIFKSDHAASHEADAWCARHRSASRKQEALARVLASPLKVAS